MCSLEIVKKTISLENETFVMMGHDAARLCTAQRTLNQNQVFSEYILQIALNNLSMLVRYCKSTHIMGKGRKNYFLKT